MKRINLLLLIVSLVISLNADSQSVDSVKIIRRVDSFLSDTLSMEQIVVTGTRFKKMLKDAPIQTQIISEREIRGSGMSKLEDVLSSQLPGMEFHQAGYGISMTFQGLDARHILILVDGERMSGDVNGNIDFSKIPTESIERIEVVKGSSSVLYGSNAMGATINIITKRPKNGFEASAFYNFGYLNQRNEKEKSRGIKSDILNQTAAAYVGYNSNKFFTTTDMTYQGVDPYRLVSKVTEKRHYKVIEGNNVDKVLYVPVDSNGISVSGWHSLAINQKVGYKFSKKLSAEIHGGYYWKNRYDLGDYSASAGTTEIGRVPIENYQGYNVDASALYAISSKHSLEFSNHFSSTYRKQDDLGTITPKQKNNINVARVLYRNSAIRNNTMTIGADMNHETLRLDLSSGGFDDTYQYNTFSLYIQDEAKLSNKIDMMLGLRLDNYGFESAKELFENMFAPDKDTSKGKGVSITPQVGIKYKIGRVSARLNYAMGFRTPSLKELYMEYYQPYMGMTIIGNPDLLPETNNYVSLSADYLSKNSKLYLSGSVYANFFKNKIDSYHAVEKDQLIYRNTAKSNLYGFDLSSRLMLLKGWWANLGYSFSHRQESGPVNSAQYIFASPHTLSLQTNYMMNLKRWDLGFNLSANYYSPKTYEDMMPTIIYNTGSLVPDIIEGVYKATLEGYVLCNVSMSAILDSHWTFTVGVNNLLNYTPAVASFNSAITPGINGYMSVRYRF